MTTATVLLDYPEEGVARVCLNRPDKHNAFTPQLITELRNVLIECEKESAIRVVVLTANGKNFSAGADINWMQQMVNASPQENSDDANALADLMRTLKYLSKPTIAQVHGAVMGGGVGLVACCDIAIASSDAFFCFSEVKIGLIPAVISPYIIQAIGERATRRYFLTAEKIPALQALQLGLIHECVPSDAVEDAVTLLIKHIKHNSPQALTACKQLITHISQPNISDEMIDYTTQAIANIRVSKEGQEGLQAFLEKRRPQWS